MLLLLEFARADLPCWQMSKAEHERLGLTAWSLVHALTLLLIDGLATEAPLFVSALVTKTLLDGIRRH